tara:strand:+ start:36912 stop:37748 length:837 start_codon:yes stop_codon:yes gene_type:complete
MMDSKEIRKRIRHLIAEQGPVARRDVVAAFRKDGVPNEEIDKTINKLISLQVLYPCSRQRVWDQDEKALLIAEAKRLIAKAPQTRVTLSRELEKLDTGASINFLRQVLFEQLQEDPEVFLHFGRNGQFLLSTEKPDVEETLKPVIPRVLSLQKAGYDRGELESALFGGQGSSGTFQGRLRSPSQESGLDFQRDACELLVFAWQDAESEETRQSLEGVMVTLGLDPVETADSTAEFSGVLHQCREKVSKGEKVRVQLPGWRLKNSRGDYLIAKAHVEKI